MSEIDEFPAGVAEKIGNYVYRLIDPRNGETFYVGKGTGNRVFAHSNANLSNLTSDEDDRTSLKLSRITEIKNAGLRVLNVIHRHDIPDAAIFEVEAALIDAFTGLTNIQGGHASGAKGPMNVVEIVDKYALPSIDEEPSEKLVLININRLEDKSDVRSIYEQTRLAWRISKRKAEAADYVLAVVKGVIVGAFVAREWRDATHANFPDHVPLDREMPERKGFIGENAPDEVWKKFVGDRGKRISIDGMKHIQFPIRYWNI
ncbi:LEM-3-like GIY-YIG domain-containing protein [Yoonia sp.]|uniref:LEM-3-like GIY-YIG domain-containing protein n=1 Tax=Yoonia sp. TaxID=2212373 RepID=UPI003A4E2CA8